MVVNCRRILLVYRLWEFPLSLSQITDQVMKLHGRVWTGADAHPGPPGPWPRVRPKLFFSFPISGSAHLDAQTQHIPTTRPASSRLAHRHAVFSPKLQLPNAPTPDGRRRRLLVPASAPALPGLAPWQRASAGKEGPDTRALATCRRCRPPARPPPHVRTSHQVQVLYCALPP